MPCPPQVIFESEVHRLSEGQCDCDCDCACSSPNLEQDFLHQEASFQVSDLNVSQYSTLPLEETHFICFGLNCKPTVVNQTTLSILDGFKNGNNHSIYGDTVKIYGSDVANQTIAKLIETGLLLGHKTVTHQAKQKNLSAWLHVTDQCNLRCDYCYLTHQHEDMSFEIGEKIIRSIFHSAHKHGYSKVKIKYAGGEPILRFENIVRWHTLAKQLATSNQIILDDVILSNGTLLTFEIARIIKELKLSLMISFDGLNDAHDFQRSYRDGHGSYQEVLRAIDIAQQVQLSPHVSVTISNKNIESIPSLVAWLLDRDLSFNLNFVRQNGNYQTEPEKKIFVKNLLQALKIIQDTPPKYSILAGMLDRANLLGSHSYPCAIEKDYIVFNSRGELFRCQMELAYTMALVANDDPVAQIRNHPDPVNIPVEQKEACQDCKWKFWCAGGCPLLPASFGKKDGVSSPICTIYQAIYPEVFRSEGFRLLKKAQMERSH